MIELESCSHYHCLLAKIPAQKSVEFVLLNIQRPAQRASLTTTNDLLYLSNLTNNYMSRLVCSDHGPDAMLTGPLCYSGKRWAG